MVVRFADTVEIIHEMLITREPNHFGFRSLGPVTQLHSSQSWAQKPAEGPLRDRTLKYRISALVGHFRVATFHSSTAHVWLPSGSTK